MPARRTQVGHDELSRTLAKLRDDAHLSGAAAARLAGDGFSQSKISRWESGRLVPSPEDVGQYAAALGTPTTVRQRLVTLARDAHASHKAAAPARIALTRTPGYQARVGRIEADSEHVATFHPVVIPGLLQTTAYMRAIFETMTDNRELIESTIIARHERQQPLNDETHRFTMVIHAGTLAWCVSSPTVMLEQLEHLAHISRRSNVRVGVVPWGAPATALPQSGFDIYDERLVIVGQLAGAAHITDPRDIRAYLELMRQLEDMAVFNSQARAEMGTIADVYRARSGA
ncbi:MAG: helix-turn-helix domain-containing protein [Pseudonocardiales bacterium]|nr:helix-turn-helix domain-containing protein [Pseudonocardiales bacterium]